MTIDVLHEDNHCLAVNKPARVLTMGDRTAEPTLLDSARDYLKEKHQKPGRVYLGVVHRLDQPVSGVVLFARTSKAAARLSEQFWAGRVQKVYLALVEGAPAEPAGTLTDHLLKDRTRNVVTSVSAGTPGAKQSELEYRLLRRCGPLSLLEVRPRTGRGHQIRVQLAARGLPICGDVKYGSKRRLGGPIALHASSLTFEHPTRREPLTVTAPVPPFWDELQAEGDSPRRD